MSLLRPGRWFKNGSKLIEATECGFAAEKVRFILRVDALVRRIRKSCPLPRRAWPCVIRRTAGSWTVRTCS